MQPGFLPHSMLLPDPASTRSAGTDKSALNVQIRPHYYTVFPAFPQQILSRKKFFELLSSNFLSSFPNIHQIQEPQITSAR